MEKSSASLGYKDDKARSLGDGRGRISTESRLELSSVNSSLIGRYAVMKGLGVPPTDRTVLISSFR